MSWETDERGDLPTVSFVVVAPEGVDGAARLSLASARQQRYPDRSCEVIAVTSVEEGIEGSTGELIAFLRAGESWVPEKTVTQVRILDERPGVGLVHGETIPFTAPEDATVGRLLLGPVAAPSTILVRHVVAQAAFPATLMAPCPYWWLTLRAAEISEIVRVDAPVAHATLETPYAAGFRRALLARAVPGTVPPDRLVAALHALPSLPALGDSAPARAAAARFEEAGDVSRAIAHLVRALALDGDDAEAAAALARLTQRRAA